MNAYPRPEAKEVYLQKRKVEGVCPQCMGHNVMAYPVVTDGGWWDVVKCQDCLHSLERKKSPNRYGSLRLLTDLL